MVYLDYNASTPVDPRVAVELASGRTRSTRILRVATVPVVWPAPSSIARGHRGPSLAGRLSRDVIFTSGASESATLALLGIGLTARGSTTRDFIVGATEHKAIRAAA